MTHPYIRQFLNLTATSKNILNFPSPRKRGEGARRADEGMLWRSSLQVLATVAGLLISILIIAWCVYTHPIHPNLTFPPIFGVKYQSVPDKSAIKPTFLQQQALSDKEIMKSVIPFYRQGATWQAVLPISLRKADIQIQNPTELATRQLAQLEPKVDKVIVVPKLFG